MLKKLLVLAAAFAAAAPACAITEAELQSRLRERLEGDRTGACVVVSVIEADTATRGRYCAQPRADGGPGYDAAFEIGSISKTMTALLVAQLIEQGRWSLDDPIEKHLPPGTTVPRFGDHTIRVRDLVTHSAGLPALPPGYAPKDGKNFYSALTEQGLLDALARTRPQPPGPVQYSNFGMMLVSLAVARAYGGDFEAALRERLFTPLGMQGAYVARPPQGQRAAQGHDQAGAATPAWTITPNLAGVGMVRATLDDMERYARLAAGIGDAPLASAMRLARQPLVPGVGINWFLRPHGALTLVGHNGATGGFWSALLIDPAARRAVVMLADTSLVNLGGLDPLPMVLLGLDNRPLRPRLAVPMSAALLKATPGEYELGRLTVTVAEREGRVFARATGQSELELKLDDHGDLYSHQVDALLRPVIEGGQVVRFTWLQGGGATEGVRRGLPVELTATNPAWKPWAGEYRLTPTFTLKIFEREGKLMLQGSGQPAFEATVTGDNRIEVARFGAVVEFRREGGAPAHTAVLRQGGQVQEGRRISEPPPARPDQPK